MTMRSGFSSKRGMQQSGAPDVGSGGTGSESGIPGSRIGRGTPVSTVAISPNSSVGATDVSDAAISPHPLEPLELIGRAGRIENRRRQRDRCRNGGVGGCDDDIARQ